MSLEYFLSKVFPQIMLQSVISFLREITVPNLFRGKLAFVMHRLERYYLQSLKLWGFHHPITSCLISIEMASFLPNTFSSSPHSYYEPKDLYLTYRRSFSFNHFVVAFPLYQVVFLLTCIYFCKLFIKLQQFISSLKSDMSFLHSFTFVSSLLKCNNLSPLKVSCTIVQHYLRYTRNSPPYLHITKEPLQALRSLFIFWSFM